MSWRVARSLLTLREQINDRYPNRNKASDGTIGDADHRNRTSDHNPWYGPGIVTALDITHDPANGVDIDRLTDELAASRDPRIKYVIANDLIMSGAGGPSPWTWREYYGANEHTRHFHLSVVASPLCDDDSPWNLPSLVGQRTARPGGGAAPSAPERTPNRLEENMHKLASGYHIEYFTIPDGVERMAIGCPTGEMDVTILWHGRGYPSERVKSSGLPKYDHVAKDYKNTIHRMRPDYVEFPAKATGFDLIWHFRPEKREYETQTAKITFL
ncbi:hypothetical protein [Saccharomonospora cyanea]|uniref:Uncharacterized protein n=1 Tax=Saccharomonospora cyanea NA-134 TaxID=882082 RepID=H5XG41_9PSEU|nr:hypothetical protein [Saccharomonospora cyanea]EHR62623.1 hypothetical protein SaccyDRAFT_3796 [Saccharomonospora cyanea NA-134]